MKENILSNTLITGSDGMVGSYVDFGVRTNRRDLDVTDLKEAITQVKKYNPKIIIHLAAETDVDRCERDPGYAFLVNGVGTYNMTVAAREIGAKFIYVSTAGVFDGEKDGLYTKYDKPNPKNFYGHSKYLGELTVQNNLEDYIIVRACWMMGGGPKKDQKFVAKIIKQLRNNKIKEIKAITDQIGAPTFGKDLIENIKKLIESDAKGIFHLSNTGRATRLDVAKAIVEVIRPDVIVTPVDSSYFNLDAKRTKNEMLDVEKGFMRPWQDALKEYLETEWK